MRKFFLLVLLATSPTAAEDSSLVAYPSGYRQWIHVKSMHIRPGHPLHHLFGGVHHIYANKQAREGYRRGKFANGATLVLDLLDARDDGFAVTEGPRRMVAVMHKDSKKYPQTGGWGFEAWRADNRKDRMVGTTAAAQCFECHAQRKKNDFVFSSYRP